MKEIPGVAGARLDGIKMMAAHRDDPTFGRSRSGVAIVGERDRGKGDTCR